MWSTIAYRLPIWCYLFVFCLTKVVFVSISPCFSLLSRQYPFSPLAANWSLTDQCFQSEKGVSMESRYEGTKSFTPCPQKIGFLAQKRPNLAQNWHFWPNVGIFGPFDPMPDQKTMRTCCVGGFSVTWMKKTFATSRKN